MYIHRSHLTVVVGLCLILACTLAPVSVFAKDYTVFYYDASGVLLQIEKLAEEATGNRHLVDIDESRLAVPMLSSLDVPLIDGSDIMMSKSATLAVYYMHKGEPAGNAQDVPASPVFVEYLQFVGDRSFVECIGVNNDDPCSFPQRCHCPQPRCCCY